MRTLPLLLLLAGCNDPAPIALVFTGATSTQPGIGYNADVGTAADVDAELVMTSSAGGATFRVSCDPQTVPGTVNHGDQHLSVEYNLGAAGWANDGGSITFTAINPYTVEFNIFMRAADPGGKAKGSFTLGGTATFKR